MKDERKRMKALGGRGMCGAGAGVAPSALSEEGESAEEGEEGAGGGVGLRLCDARLGFVSSGAGASKKKKDVGVGVGGGASLVSAGGAIVGGAKVKSGVDCCFESSNAPGVRFVANAIPGASAGSVHTSCVPDVGSKNK
jgi:hypothetical protein